MYPDDSNKPAQCADSCGTLPECAPLAVPYVPFQQKNPKRYSQADALSSGTLFPGLNLPFKMKSVATGVPVTPLTELQSLEFVLQELALYLDTHPSDGEAFELFRQYAALEQESRARYVAQSGPVMRGETADFKTYNWLKDPWPWNYQEGGSK